MFGRDSAADVVITSAGGTLSAAHRNEIQLVSPLLTAYLIAGAAATCEVTAGCRREAISLAVAVLGPVPWCMECTPK